MPTSSKAYIDLLQTGGLSKARQSAYEALAQFGPATARELAELAPAAGGACLWKRLSDLEVMGLIHVVEERNCKVALKAEGRERKARVYAVDPECAQVQAVSSRKVLDVRRAQQALAALLAYVETTGGLGSHEISEEDYQAASEHLDWLTAKVDARQAAYERTEREKQMQLDLIGLPGDRLRRLLGLD